MALEKNDIVRLTISDIGTDGEGIGKVDGYTLFVKDAVIGDTITARVIKLKKNYGYGRLMEVIEPSKDRVEPVCPVARQCGGCNLQELAYPNQLEFKRRIIENNIRRIGGLADVSVEKIIGTFIATKHSFRWAPTRTATSASASTPDIPIPSSRQSAATSALRLTSQL